MPEEIVLGNYKFSDFTISNSSTVCFKATNNNSSYATQEDSEFIKDEINNNLGKWESVIKTGIHVFAELGIIQPEQTTLQNYEKSFGMELYECKVSLSLRDNCIWVSISLTQGELQKRQGANVSPIIQIQEITNQMRNIPKWRAFGKTMKIIKEQWI